MLPDLERRPSSICARRPRICRLCRRLRCALEDLGDFVEVVKPQAVDRALTGSIVALFNHDPASCWQDAEDVAAGKDTRGLAFTLDPAPTQAGRETLNWCAAAM